MSLHLGRQSIVVLNSTEGAPGRFEAIPVNADPVLVQRCSLQAFRTSREDRNSTDVALARFELFAPATAPLTPTSKVRLVTTETTATSFTFTIDGQPKVFYVTDPVHDVDGEIAIWPDRQDRPHHIECYLKERRP